MREAAQDARLLEYFRRNGYTDPMDEAVIRDNIAAVRERIDAAARRSGRDPAGIRLVAVSKFHPAQEIAAALRAGQLVFGESRVQEALEKFPGLREGFPALELHMIGHLQSNKAKAAAGLFDCVQSVDSLEIARRLSLAATEAGRTIKVLCEVHTGEESKAGFRSDGDLWACLDAAASLPGIRFGGLMTMAPYTREAAPIRASFRKLAALGREWQVRYPALASPVISMGMSNDYEIAIEEGSGMLRIGTAIFGERGA
jgi:pyridoxal phosphate enzyme (YggS family)